MVLGWNEIKSRAIAFSAEWKGETNENAEAKSFWDGFFSVFGISRRRMAAFEAPVKKLGNRQGFIDLFWKGNLIVEHKSKGKDLDKAYQQAIEYFPGLREEELPKYILVSDFERFRLYDLEEGQQHDFLLSELHQNIKLFDFIAGYNKTKFVDEHPINIKAAEKIGKLHDRLKEVGYQGHDLEVYLVRMLFLFFADDTAIFEKDLFWDLVENHTAEDGSDLAIKLAQLFQTLNTPPDKRLKNLDEIFGNFPFINGKLFEETVPIAAFDKEMRQIVLENCSIDWALISPAIFGSLFQSIMDKTERRNLGAHYTSEKNILKVIKPLFLDELWKEFEKIKQSKRGLIDFHNKISKLRFLDPACGSGNFLIIAYRELRELELQVILQKQTLEGMLNQMSFLDLKSVFKVDIDKFYGIEIDEWAARIAEVAMWLIDHQMNLKASNLFNKYIANIPIQKAANIVHGNSLTTDWSSLLNSEKTLEIYANKAEIIHNRVSEPIEKYKKVRIIADSYEILDAASTDDPINNINYDYILGNPPFIGHHMQNENQKKDLHFVLKDIRAAGVLDYVTAWYYKAAQYIVNTPIKVAFVSTNSIVQGEQVGILWSYLLNLFNVKIHFAHRTFKWSNEAKGNAAVYCVIIGFANIDTDTKILYEYEDIKGEAHEIAVKNINPYLIDAKNLLIENRSTPLCSVPKMMYGSKPTDGGYYLFTDDEKIEFLKKEPQATEFMKPLISAKEYINGEKRWCLWLVDATPKQIEDCPLILKRISQVRKFRISSKAESTRNYKLHKLFRQVTQPKNNYLLIPRTTSENREYIPIGFFTKENIVSDTCLSVPNATLFHFGILTSTMHVAWVKQVCGRLKSDFRYSKDIVYNNFPWPTSPSEKQIHIIEAAAQLILDVRLKYPESSLANLYNPLTMPPDLVKAHQQLDKAVDLCYRPQAFTNERTRIEFLFDLYTQYVAPLQAQLDKLNKKTKRLKS